MKNYLISADEVAADLGISKGYAYKLLRGLNDELKKAGYLTISGKVPRPYWEKKCFGLKEEVEKRAGL